MNNLKMKSEQMKKDIQLMEVYLSEIRMTLKCNHLNHTAGMMEQAQEVFARIKKGA